MESHQQGKAVQIEMQRLNGELSAHPEHSHSKLCLMSVIILLSVGMVACVIFIFVLKPECVQEDMPLPAQTTGKLSFTLRLQENKQKEPYEIFRVEKDGRYLIHGWLRRSTNVSGEVRLVHVFKSNQMNLDKKIESRDILYFKAKAQLFCNSTVSLSQSQHTDGYFYMYEL